MLAAKFIVVLVDMKTELTAFSVRTSWSSNFPIGFNSAEGEKTHESGKCYTTDQKEIMGGKNSQANEERELENITVTNMC